jgi:SAM-dependent methyltransferase
VRLLYQWLDGLSPAQKILDLGCGAGSLRTELTGLSVFGVDISAKTLARNKGLASACAESQLLPFTDASFDLVICNHSLEHFGDARGTILEIRRVLKPDGRLFVTVPDGMSLTDRLYRLLFCGGGHLQMYSFQGIVSEIESGTGLHLAAWKDLFSSFIFVDKRNFTPAPVGPFPAPLPRRMRWVGSLPSGCFAGARILLNLATRLVDNWSPTRLSRYGWALAFCPEKVTAEEEPGSTNVCMFCGAGFDEAPRERIAAGLLYRCPQCLKANCVFREAHR